jgi:peroxiredoxin (alkyl hydroperoxide reductase subunit C)
MRSPVLLSDRPPTLAGEDAFDTPAEVFLRPAGAAAPQPARPAPLTLGDVVPDFSANSTAGPFRLHDWAAGHWTHVFTQPEPFHPVGTSELMGIARHRKDFDALGVRNLCIANYALHFQSAWAHSITNAFGLSLGFPQIEDPDGTLLAAIGIGAAKDRTGQAIRTSLVIDPMLRLRIVFDYPVNLGRSIRETLRVIEGLQTAEELRGICLPADWEDGEPLLLSPETTATAADSSYRDIWTAVTPWYRTVDV